VSAFSDAFGRDLSSEFDDITCNITLNPICLRFLAARSFDLFHYFTDAHVYESFKTMTAGGAPILTVLDEIYINTDIIGFMEQGLDLFKKYEEEIKNSLLF